MRFECDSCNAKYKISADKVRGRVVRFPCRKCDHKILVDGRQHDADVTVPAGEAYSFDDVTRRSEPASPFSKHEAATARARRPSSPPRRRSPSVPPRRSSAASRRVSSIPTGTTPAAAAASAFVGEKHALTPPLPDVTIPNAAPMTGQRPEWHVSVNEVPIGPIRLEEMGHKIDAGAVSEYSLVWREGFEDWRPLATVPELMSLLHERRHSGPPSRSTFSSMPPFVETRPSLSDPAPAASVPAPMPFTSSPLSSSPLSSSPHSSSPLNDPSAIALLADALQPESDLDLDVGLDAASQPPASLGPEDVFHSSPRLGSYSGLPPTADDEVSIPSVPPAPAAAKDDSNRISLGVWSLIVAVIVFGGVSAFLAYERFGDQLLNQVLESLESLETKRAVTPAPVKPAPPEPAASAPELESEALSEADAETDLAADGEEGIDDAVDVEEADAEAVDTDESEESEPSIVPPPNPKMNKAKVGPAPRPKPRARRRPRPAPAAAPEPAPKQVSDEDQKVLDEFNSGTEAAPAKIAVKQATNTQSNKPALDGNAVRQTVSENKARLQRCYERAIRGQTNTGAVRLDVTVQVSSSGRVKSVTASEGGPGGLAECIEASVRRWRFPQTSEGGPAKFPLVFSAN
jgi:predicted Zn finger-like uncharacterized protein